MAATLTPFGEKCREFRTAAGVRMIDQARALKCSSTFISLIETGEKQPPEGYVERFAYWLKLSSAETDLLQALADAKTKVIQFRPKDPEKAAAARRLFKRINSLGPDEIRKLEELIEKEAAQ